MSTSQSATPVSCGIDKHAFAISVACGSECRPLGDMKMCTYIRTSPMTTATYSVLYDGSRVARGPVAVPRGGRVQSCVRPVRAVIDR